MCEKYFVEVWDDFMGPTAGYKLDLWVSRAFINCIKNVFSTGQWSPEVHVDLLPWAVQ